MPAPAGRRADALLQPASREAFQRLLAQGWMDSLRVKHPEEPIYTFWDYFRNHWQTNSGLRIDHLLLSAKLESRLIDAQVDTWVRGRPHASDHAPVWIQLKDQRVEPGPVRSRPTPAPKKKTRKKRGGVRKANR